MARRYHTLIVWTPGETEKTGFWSDEFGSYSRNEVQGEKEFAYDHFPRGHVKIVSHDDGAENMIAARDAVPAPKGWTVESAEPAKKPTVDDLKSRREFDAAGRQAFTEGKPRAYGCHFGMRSTRGEAESAFLAGYDAAKREAEKLKTETNIKNLPDGEYFTEIGYSQQYPWVVVKRTGKTVTLARVIVTDDPEWISKREFYPGGFFGHTANQHAQTWIFARIDYSNQVIVRKTQKGWTRKSVRFVENRAVEFYDYNF